MEIYFITGNENKFKEAKEILNEEIKQIDLDLPEIQEIDAKKVIEAKLLEAKKSYPNHSFIVEDSSLYIDCLGGLPGPLIKWFMKTLDVEGIADLAKKYENQSAKAVTYIGYLNGDEIKFVKGEVKGMIVSPIGENGFGWDKIFMPEGFDKTFSQMTDEEKNKVSMRKLAFEELKKIL